MEMAIRPFTIHVSGHKIERLQQKLALADFPDESAGLEISWDQGPPVAEIKRLANVWQTTYEWRAAEARLNALPQFLASVEVEGMGTYDIHHVHKQSPQPGAIPLLFLHGWPGGFFEVTKLLDGLVQNPDGPTFHVVAPSLVDYGFSSAGGTGFTVDHHAEAYHKLMLSLGYSQYVIQAGDLGYPISRFMARKFGGSHCVAYHTNTAAPAQPDAEAHPELQAKLSSTPLSEAEQQGLARAASFGKEGLGYFKVMATKPRTVGFGLRDSPVGLLAWIYEKLHAWADNYRWTDDEVLTWVSVHYFSAAGPEATSNIYHAMEHAEPPVFAAASAYVDVPLGIARFEGDLLLMPRLWYETLGPIVSQSGHQAGGHFAAWEKPDDIVVDLREMFAQSERLYSGEVMLRF